MSRYRWGWVNCWIIKIMMSGSRSRNDVGPFHSVVFLPCGASSEWLVGVRVDLLWVGTSLGDADRSQDILLVCFLPIFPADVSVIETR
jgi:hypothetical protein